MHYRRPPYEEYIKDWHLDMENLEMTHKCGFVGGWRTMGPRPSGIWPSFKSSVEEREKFFKMLEEQGYTEFEDKSCALADILRQVEEIYVRNFKKILEERHKDPEYLKKHLAPEPKPAPKKLHWAPVSSMYQKIVKNFNRIQSR